MSDLSPVRKLLILLRIGPSGTEFDEATLKKLVGRLSTLFFRSVHFVKQSIEYMIEGREAEIAKRKEGDSLC